MRITCLLAILTLTVAAHAADPPSTPSERAADRACAQAMKALNFIAEPTKSYCMVPRGGVRTIVFGTDSAVFANESYRRAYVGTLVATTGDALTRNPESKVVEVTFIDQHLGAQRKYWAISAIDAKRLQIEIKNDRMTLDQYTDAVFAAGRLVDIPPKK